MSENMSDLSGKCFIWTIEWGSDALRDIQWIELDAPVHRIEVRVPLPPIVDQAHAARVAEATPIHNAIAAMTRPTRANEL